MVHGRKKKASVDEFGVSGYVYKDVFLNFDQRTESLCWSLDDTRWTAVSGPRKGETIPFIAEPPVVELGEWQKNIRTPWSCSARGARLKAQETTGEHAPEFARRRLLNPSSSDT